MIYDRKTLLSLKLRSMTTLRKMTRAEFFTRLQLNRTIEPLTNKLWKEVEEKIWREHLDDDPHGQPWHVSFHASQYPGNDPMACPRQALYRLMDFPDPEPTTRWLRATASAGKSIEVELVGIWHKAGILLSAPPDSEHQTGFAIEEAWLTGSVDSVIKLGNMPVPVEIKTKWQRVIEAMQQGRQGPDEKHVSQIKTQLGLVRAFQEALWPGMEPVTHGYIYYLSRDEPSNTAEFRIDYDEEFFVMGLERLKKWRTYFEEDVLPSINPSKKHPMGWKWSYPPCQFCPHKKTCKLDHEQKVEQLSESIGVGRAKLVRKNYDAEIARLKVRARWNKKEQTPIAT